MALQMHKHWAILLTAVVLLLFQFILEFHSVYALYYFVHSLMIYSYKFFIDLALMHVAISVVLIVWGRRLAIRFYKEA